MCERQAEIRQWCDERQKKIQRQQLWTASMIVWVWFLGLVVPFLTLHPSVSPLAIIKESLAIIGGIVLVGTLYPLGRFLYDLYSFHTRKEQ